MGKKFPKVHTLQNSIQTGQPDQAGGGKGKEHKHFPVSGGIEQSAGNIFWHRTNGNG